MVCDGKFRPFYGKKTTAGLGRCIPSVTGFILSLSLSQKTAAYLLSVRVAAAPRLMPTYILCFQVGGVILEKKPASPRQATYIRVTLGE